MGLIRFNHLRLARLLHETQLVHRVAHRLSIVSCGQVRWLISVNVNRFVIIGDSRSQPALPPSWFWGLNLSKPFWAGYSSPFSAALISIFGLDVLGISCIDTEQLKPRTLSTQHHGPVETVEDGRSEYCPVFAIS